MTPVLDRLLRSGTVSVNGHTVPLHSGISATEGDLLQRVIRAIKPTTTLEVGMAFGVSTLFICEALAEVGGQRHHAIDPCQRTQWHGAGLTHVHEAGYGDIVTLHEEGSELALPKLLSQGHRVDVAFIDGWHTFDHALVDFFYVNRMLAVGGAVIFDDVAWPSLAKVVRHVASYPAYEIMDMTPPDPGGRRRRLAQWLRGERPLGSMVALRKIAEDARSWDWWAPF